MKKHELETLTYSVVGVAAMFLILVAFNLIAGALKQRVDLTEEKLYTLSAGTKKILSQLENPVEIRFYYTQAETEVPPQIKNYAQRVEDLLSEYKEYGKGKIRIKKLNPTPDSDAEDSANLDGIEGQMLPNGEKLYFGVAISQADDKVALPFLAPDRENLLEYDVSRAVSQVSAHVKPVVGVMTPLPVFGQPMNPMMARMGQQQGQDPWVVITELQRDFDVRQIQMDVDKIDDDVKVLMVIHPKDITDKAQYAIDQFLMRGGKLVALLDAMALVDSRSNPQMPQMPQMPGGPSSLDKLLKAWGITFENTKVVADANFITRFMRNNQPDAAPTVLSVTPKGINGEDVVSSQIDNLLLPFAGAFSGTPVEGIKETVLVHTTTDSQMVDGFMAQMSGDAVMKDFKASGTQYPLAIRLAGKFKTAFPDGKPEEKKEEAKDGEKNPEEKKETGTSLKQSPETAVILVADADFIYDQFCVQIQNIFGQKIIIPRNGNLNFAQNMVEQMAGDSNLIGVRSRATLNRPFTVVREMQAQAEAKHREELKKVEASLQETQRRLNELQSQKEGNQRFILSPEQQAELEKFKQEEAKAKKHLKEVRKQLRQDIDSLEAWTKALNIFGMPALVVFAGLAVALVKKQRTKAA